jgi:hypothetical protein
MFIITANVFHVYDEHKTSTFGIFSNINLAKEAIDIIVERYRKTEDEDDPELEWIVGDYRSHFKIIELPNVDNFDFFKNGNLPYF